MKPIFSSREAEKLFRKYLIGLGMEVWFPFRVRWSTNIFRIFNMIAVPTNRRLAREFGDTLYVKVIGHWTVEFRKALGQVRNWFGKRFRSNIHVIIAMKLPNWPCYRIFHLCKAAEKHYYLELKSGKKIDTWYTVSKTIREEILKYQHGGKPNWWNKRRFDRMNC